MIIPDSLEVVNSAKAYGKAQRDIRVDLAKAENPSWAEQKNGKRLA